MGKILFISMKKDIKDFFKKIPGHTWIVCILILLVECTKHFPVMADGYARIIYPAIAKVLGAFSQMFPFAIGDLFIACCVVWLTAMPFYMRFHKKQTWKKTIAHEIEFLLWIYVWFYMAWGLNYSQKNFYERTGIPYRNYMAEDFNTFTDSYIDSLNNSYTTIGTIDKTEICTEILENYPPAGNLPGIHPPFLSHPKAKTMLFTPLASMVGVTGSMGPFFCEFTINGDVLPLQYPATFAHELSHFQGISREAEANLYAYLACIRSEVPFIRFSGYMSLLPHVLSNASRLLEKEEYARLFDRIRPEIITLAKQNQQYWSEKYSPVIGNIQNWIYDLYLKGNRISSGRKNYSEVVGLLISYQKYENTKTTKYE